MKPNDAEQQSGQGQAFWASTPARNVRRGYFWVPGIIYDPPRASAMEVRLADPATLRIPALDGIPVVVSGETSVQARYAPKIVDFLKTAGAAAEGLHLPDRGVRGNGHGLIYEKISDEALALVLRWLAAHTNNTAAAS